MIKNLLIASSLVFALYGCGGDATCESVCEDSKECPDATEEEKAQDCATVCQAQEALIEGAGCTEQYDALLSCGGDVDVCAENDDTCNAEETALQECLTAGAGN